MLALELLDLLLVAAHMSTMWATAFRRAPVSSAGHWLAKVSIVLAPAADEAKRDGGSTSHGNAGAAEPPSKYIQVRRLPRMGASRIVSGVESS